MSLALSADAGKTWAPPLRAGRFDWQFQGCPHVGGGIAFSNARNASLYAAVWSGVQPGAGVYALRSDDLGLNWTSPKRMGSETASHPDLATAGKERIAVVWDAREGETSQVFAAFSEDGGETWGAPVKISDGSSDCSHPRVVGTQAGFRVFWFVASGERPQALGSAALP
jgi:Neuraminidase (sialidase)